MTFCNSVQERIQNHISDSVGSTSSLSLKMYRWSHWHPLITARCIGLPYLLPLPLKIVDAADDKRHRGEGRDTARGRKRKKLVSFNCHPPALSSHWRLDTASAAAGQGRLMPPWYNQTTATGEECSHTLEHFLYLGTLCFLGTGRFLGILGTFVTLVEQPLPSGVLPAQRGEETHLNSLRPAHSLTPLS